MKCGAFAIGFAASLSLALLTVGCQRTTGKLSPDLQARFEKEGITHRADDVYFRQTSVGDAGDGSWNERRASIVVTNESVFLHVNGKSLVAITPRSTGRYEVSRDRDRISLRAGGGKSAFSWSFRPPEDAAKWAADMRAVIKSAKGR